MNATFYGKHIIPFNGTPLMVTNLWKLQHEIMRTLLNIKRNN